MFKSDAYFMPYSFHLFFEASLEKSSYYRWELAEVSLYFSFNGRFSPDEVLCKSAKA